MLTVMCALNIMAVSFVKLSPIQIRCPTLQCGRKSLPPSHGRSIRTPASRTAAVAPRRRPEAGPEAASVRHLLSKA